MVRPACLVVLAAATAALYTMRFDLPRPIQMDVAHGLWLFNAGAVAATDTTFTYWQAGA